MDDAINTSEDPVWHPTEAADSDPLIAADGSVVSRETAGGRKTQQCPAPWDAVSGTLSMARHARWSGAGHAAAQGCRGGPGGVFREGYSSFSLCHAPFQTIWR